MSQKNDVCVRKWFYPHPPEISELNLPLSTNEIRMCRKKDQFTNSVFSMSKVVFKKMYVFIYSAVQTLQIFVTLWYIEILREIVSVITSC